ncbi:hypothetical protein KR038_006607 [Drosophila bunnanda]|nr:hypothetical protein KR038_006607 [Drosophila bunnanda]
MKPEQLNRLIRSNGRMQPWFLRNTSELYESAVRSYYEHGLSATANTQPRSVQEPEDNSGPVRKLKTADPKPSHADEYPRSHHMQAKQASNIASGQLLPSRMHTSRQRSMSFSVGGKDMARASSGARPYSIFGQAGLADSSSTNISCTSSQPSNHMLGTETLPRCLQKSRAMARSERKKTGRRGNKVTEVNNSQPLDMDMRLFSARSLSVPPPTGLGMGHVLPSLTTGQMPPCRKHHMKAMEKTTLAKVAFIPMGEGDSLMTVDDTLKRKISVIDAVRGYKTSSELGHHLTTKEHGNLRNSSNLLDVIRQPPKMRFRFHTQGGLWSRRFLDFQFPSSNSTCLFAGDRAKQFEYIQFADGPVSTYAFNRRSQAGGYQHRLHKGSSTSSSSSLNTIGRQENQPLQPRQVKPLTPRNVLHANHMQRSRSLETSSGHILETPKQPEPESEVEDVYRHLETLRSTRGSSVDISSRLSARKHTAGQNSGKEHPALHISHHHHHHHLSSPSASSMAQLEGTAVAQFGQINSEGIKSIQWADNGGENRGSRPVRTDTIGQRQCLQCAESGLLERYNLNSSRPKNSEFRGSTQVAPKVNSNFSAYNVSIGIPRDTDWRGSSLARAQSQRSSVGASFKRSSMDPSDVASGVFVEESSPYPTHHKPARMTCAAVRRPQFKRSPADGDLSPYLSKVQSRTQHKIKTTVEKSKARSTKVTTNRVSHRSLFQAAEEENLSAGHSPYKNQHNQREESEKKSEQREQNLDMHQWKQGSRATAVPSSLPVKTSPQLKEPNQLLAASASQVSAYKRAFRTQQQMLKVEALHQQAQNMPKSSLKLNPSRSSESRSHFVQLQQPAADLRPSHLPRMQSRQGPTLTVSRTSVRAALKGTADGIIKRVGSRISATGSPRSPVKAVGKCILLPLARLSPNAAIAIAATSATAPVQKSQTPRTRTTGGKGAATVAKAAEGILRTKPGGDLRSGWTAERAMRQSALMQTMQQQHSRNGSGSGNGSGNGGSSGKGSPLLGFRRETANRAAFMLQQRRDESEQTLSPKPRQHQRQQQQHCRQFHFQNTPWRPSY